MAKKSFIKEGDNPALQFLSGTPLNIKKAEPKEKAAAGGNQKPAAAGKKKAPEGYKLNPEYIEKRTQRAQIVLQPSLYQDAKEYSEELGISFNDLVHRALYEAVHNEYMTNLLEGDIANGK